MRDRKHLVSAEVEKLVAATAVARRTSVHTPMRVLKNRVCSISFY